MPGICRMIAAVCSMGTKVQLTLSLRGFGPPSSNVPDSAISRACRATTADWLGLQSPVSKLPAKDRLFVESFPTWAANTPASTVFAGRNANCRRWAFSSPHRMDRMDLGANRLRLDGLRRAHLVLERLSDPAPLFAEKNLREDFEPGLPANAVMKRTFRAARGAGMLERRSVAGPEVGPGRPTFSSDYSL